ncbi:AIG2 family protein [Desulfotomaculum nigrificans CO-1-SRB]|uniref:AIG2 family protein n=1 Tax=Desulfotomaculum nigrificans (strain DSM 14880 / VKM B-2319 / CO-1-SRB) TaxID=868595 RepID=F6B886_DESCC|nr:gamma-glutamylcyclotransferase family protein [Desulfotomaculum nigrificans]AEF93531.1 AIG2 family protein [Desulfotomaculum nigrificans CO-1-SRB]
MTIKHVFVYGTLMMGLSNHQVIQPYVQSIQPAEMKGRLYDLLYGYPAMIAGEEKVIGELVELVNHDQALVELDQLENYWGEGEARNLYNRVVQEAKLADGRKVAAYVYLWAKAEEIPNIGVHVADGSWRRFKFNAREE